MTSEESHRLEVPMVYQEEEFFCVPACIKMVLSYLNSRMLTTPAPDFSLKDIAKIVKTQDGTKLEDIRNMNSSLIQAIPSVEFEAEYKTRVLQEIVDEMLKRRPVIAYEGWTDRIHKIWHAVVVTEIGIDVNQISYNDPQLGPKVERLSIFQPKWEAAYTTLVKVQIGQKTRTVLEQFATQGERG